MSKITWDKKTGGVLLKRHISKETLSVSPRPVFFEELDLLKLKEKGWSYPECKEPLLWACNKLYYYRGEQVFEVNSLYLLSCCAFGSWSDCFLLDLEWKKMFGLMRSQIHK